MRNCSFLLLPLPCTLIFAITTLNLFVLSAKNLFLENLCALPLFNSGHLQDLRRVQPGVITTAHNGYVIDGHLEYGNAGIHSLIAVLSKKRKRNVRMVREMWYWRTYGIDLGWSVARIHL